MKTISGLKTIFCLAILAALAGCGGGGSGDTVPTAATTKLSTQGTLPQGVQLSGVGVTLRLPAGVTVATESNGAVKSSVITVSGVAAQAGPSSVAAPIYTPATSTTQGTLAFAIAAGNFGIGEFATVNLDLAPGSTAPSASDVVVFAPADQNLRPVTTLTPAVGVQLK